MFAIAKEKISSRNLLNLQIPLNRDYIPLNFFSLNGRIQTFYLKLHSGFKLGFDYEDMYNEYRDLTLDGYRIKGSKIENILINSLLAKLSLELSELAKKHNEQFFIEGRSLAKQIESYLLNNLKFEMNKPDYHHMPFQEFKEWLIARKENEIYKRYSLALITAMLQEQLLLTGFHPNKPTHIFREWTFLSLIDCPMPDYEISNFLVSKALQLSRYTHITQSSNSLTNSKLKEKGYV
jgi:hypothetical protein